jgi:raffinose/stachyose/melibiose transport system substrate-binding protein
MGLLAGCGGETPTATPALAPTATTAASTGGEPTATTASSTGTDATATSGTGTSAEATVTPTFVPAVTNANAKVTVRWWHIATAKNQRDYFQTVANTYMKDHPDVNIDITVLENEAFKSKLATAMQSGDPPDVFQSWGGGALAEYANAGLVKDITADLQKDGWGDTFQPGPLSLYKVGDKNYGVPWEAGMVGFWYNKALFAQAGISSPPSTWTDFLDAVKKLKAANITPIAIGEGDKWPGAFYWEYLAIRIGGKDAFDKAYSRSGSFADDAFVQAGQHLKELVDLQPFQTGFLGADYPSHQSIMANGKAAMELMGQWAPGADRAVSTDVDTFNKNLGFFGFPSVEGGAGDPSDVLGGADGFAFGKNSTPEAIDFARFFTSVENQKGMAAANVAVLPVVKGAEGSVSDSMLQDVLKTAGNAKYYQLYYDQYMPPAVGSTVNDSTQAVFAGTMTPEQAAQAIDASAATELKK